ncbi:hypothetical protein OQH60_06195 [Campylobacter sp. MIT 21-1685]|uniref:hypothetical protein n=1 Tax=unclassified Campylobacter TaxID=2593542 RepID=UPI00224A6178|nr:MULTISPECIES: hypothetical protein [unclassified Campylobacter]MCX2683443.1 hypothetical protein [Campylobacter sp. MIT 21-1684]MCX2751735.1 hypothetical protein [Campylobacter sp. MIT 21-1682]MCX2807937.1 hypothetical protein [Campylobacter sp. MIT 21-1685]
MTIKDLKNFRNAIHRDLKISPQNEKSSCFIVREEKKESAIQRIEFTFKNQDDVLIIRQEAEKCSAIKNLFETKPNLDSCDFIVLLCKNRNIKICFCEIKSSKSKENQEKALKQINSSKIFLEYLCKCYKEHFDSAFEFSSEMTENIYIYPASNSQKNRTSSLGSNFKFKSIKIDNGKAIIDNGYEFFRD